MNSKDRRRGERLDTALPVSIRFLPDGTPIQGSGIEVGPNGMRLITTMPLVEASYIHISFVNASNNTHCEGRVVWTQRNESNITKYESGIDIQRWGGDVPGSHFLKNLPNTRAKDDRRKTKR
jgi:hypothetical protein